jgi:hypothetical protein
VILGKIWCSLVGFLPLLRWQEWVRGVLYPGISINKLCVLQICSAAVLFLHLLAGRGGEGEMEYGDAVGGAEGWRGFSSDLVQFFRGGRLLSLLP